MRTLSAATIAKWTLPNRAAAFDLFSHDLAHEGYEAAVNRAIKTYGLKLTQAMYDTLVSAVFNLGVNALFDLAHFPALVKALRARDYRAIAKALLDYDHARDPNTGERVRVPGLTNRRRAEYQHFGSDGWAADPVRDRMHELRAHARLKGWTPLSRNLYHQAETRIRLRRTRRELGVVVRAKKETTTERAAVDVQKSKLRQLRAEEEVLRK